jgi:hypothetical protein
MLFLYLKMLFAIFSLKNTTTVLLALTAHQALDRVGIHGLDMNFMNSSSEYFVNLSIPASETVIIRKNASCGSVSPSTTDCRNQLQK